MGRTKKYLRNGGYDPSLRLPRAEGIIEIRPIATYTARSAMTASRRFETSPRTSQTRKNRSFESGQVLEKAATLADFSWAYPKLIHYSKVDKGGHFAAWEQPQLFSEEVRAGFRSQRT